MRAFKTAWTIGSEQCLLRFQSSFEGRLDRLFETFETSVERQWRLHVQNVFKDMLMHGSKSLWEITCGSLIFVFFQSFFKSILYV